MDRNVANGQICGIISLGIYQVPWGHYERLCEKMQHI